jgi:hypothetical protein
MKVKPRIVLGPNRLRGEEDFHHISFGGFDVVEIIPNSQMTTLKNGIIPMK